jgi:uncharacterized membrane protein
MMNLRVFKCSLFFAVIFFIVGLALVSVNLFFGPNDWQQAWNLEEIGFPLFISGIFIWCTSLIAIAIVSKGGKQD